MWWGGFWIGIWVFLFRTGSRSVRFAHPGSSTASGTPRRERMELMKGVDFHKESPTFNSFSAQHVRFSHPPQLTERRTWTCEHFKHFKPEVCGRMVSNLLVFGLLHDVLCRHPRLDWHGSLVQKVPCAFWGAATEVFVILHAYQWKMTTFWFESSLLICKKTPRKTNGEGALQMQGPRVKNAQQWKLKANRKLGKKVTELSLFCDVLSLPSLSTMDPS